MMEPKPGERYQHFKGVVVNIIAIARHTETLEEMVIYEHEGEVWARPKESFCEVLGNETTHYCRFTLIPE